MGSLRLRLLGEFGVEGIDLASASSRKERLLLRLLALGRGRFIGTDLLVEALWGGMLPAKPADQVAVLASRLRRRLGRERIEHGDTGYRLRYDWLDADELEQVVAEVERRQASGSKASGSAVGAARTALALARGDPGPIGADAPWVTDELAVLQRLVRRARRVAAETLYASGSWLEAAELMAAELDHDPYDEEAVRLLMRANTAGGRPGVALAAYAELRRRLLDDLGAEPAPDTSALHGAVLRGEVPHPTGQPHVSGAAVALVGRARELARLDQLADRSHAGRVEIGVVVGEAGIGKTTLLRAWTARRAEAGDIVLLGTCGELDRSIPLDALLVALAAHLRSLDSAASAALLGHESELLAPLLGVPGAGAQDPALSAALPASSAPAAGDAVLGPAVLFAALATVLQRLTLEAPVVLVIDDAHLAGTATVEWLQFLRRRSAPLVVVAAVRVGEGEPISATEVIELGPLDRSATAELVGPGRADRLYAHSLGHPLFLTELASSDGAVLPDSLVEAVSGRCDELGDAGALLRAAAVIGPRIDLDLLAAVLSRPAIDVLDGVELAVQRGLLVEESGVFSFRHDLVRVALATGTAAGRAALLHREAGRVLARRPGADPVQVAEHAVLGGDRALAARSLRAGAERAAERFDHPTSERLLDEALLLHPDDAGRLARARVRTRRGRYAEALEDVARARTAGAEALEVAAWATYFGRRFEQAIGYAQDGELAADDPVTRARCQIVGGRTHHAQGDLATAQRLLAQALQVTVGPDRIAASAWLGIVRAHQSRHDEALHLLRPAAQRYVGVEQTSATLHALLFTGHAHALAGRPADALAAFSRYTVEVERRQVPRFAGRGVNFGGWVLRNIGATDRGVDAHLEAVEAGTGLATPEVLVAALEDLAEERLVAGDLDGVSLRLREAQDALVGDLVFGWRLELKLRLLRCRLALASGRAEDALGLATGLARDASRIGVPRYSSVARLLAHRATAALGGPVDLAAVERDLDEVERAVALEAWWWYGDTGADLGVSAWVERATAVAGRLAGASGSDADLLRAEVERRTRGWLVSAR